MHNVVLSHYNDLKLDLVLILTYQESMLFDKRKFASEATHRSARQFSAYYQVRDFNG